MKIPQANCRRTVYNSGVNQAWPPYPLQIPEEVLKKLAPLQKRESRTDALCRTENAIEIFSGVGAPAYLSLDGDIFQNDGFESCEVALRYASEEMIGAYLLVGAWRTKIPELMELLPPAPEGTEVCPECEGIKPWDPELDQRPVWCRRCAARGWVYIAPRAKVFEGPPYQRRFAAEEKLTKKWWQRLVARS
jgi:hypothetical protein